MLQVFLTRTHLAIAMEYAQGGDLFRYVLRHKAARLAESQARWIFQQLVIGLDFCHRSVRTPLSACLRGWASAACCARKALYPHSATILHGFPPSKKFIVPNE